MLLEHDRVITVRPFTDNTHIIPKNTVGTIVGVHKKGEAYEVEFPEVDPWDMPIVVTIPGEYLVMFI